jgi:Zn-dependent metalloprotease
MAEKTVKGRSPVSQRQLSDGIKKMRARDPKIAITFNPERSAIAILRGRLAAPVDVTKLRKAPYEHARDFIRENRKLLDNIDEKTELADGKASTDRRNMTHVLLDQKHGGARVLGGAVSVHYAADGSVCLLKSSLALKIDAPKRPRVTAARAAQIARKHAGRGAIVFQRMKPTLVVVNAKTVRREKNGLRHYLCWQIGIVSPEGSREPGWMYFVDALDGKVVFRHPQFGPERVTTPTAHP